MTIGPKMDEGLIQAWNLQAMRQPIKDQQIPTEYEPDLAALFRKLPPSMYPDLYLWVESVNGHFPRNLESRPDPEGLLPHRQPSESRVARAMGEAVRPCVHRPAGIPPGVPGRGKQARPLAPARAPIPRSTGESAEIKKHNIGFVGSLNTERRVRLLNAWNRFHKVTYQRCFWTDMADFFARAGSCSTMRSRTI